MALFLFRFWPVLIPLVVYVLWHLYITRKAIKKGAPIPRFRDGPIYWMILSSLAIAVICFLALGLTHQKNDGNYIPPHMENGKIIPGRVEP